MTSTTQDLFTPLQAGAISLNHRVVMAPLTRMRAQPPEHAPTAVNAEYYAQRASAGGLIITEATDISPQAKGFPQTPAIFSEPQVAGWRQVVEQVHAKGGRIFLQIWHTGRISHSSHHADGALPVAPSAITPAGEAFGAEFKTYPFETPRALALNEIPRVIEEFRHAAKQAKAAGFDGIELHAANGFLIDQFLQDKSNQRQDLYGGSINNRLRFLLETLTAIEEIYPSEAIGVRLSPFGNLGDIGDSAPHTLFSAVIQQLAQRNLAYLHLVEPRANVGLSEEQNNNQPESVAALFRPLFPGVIIASGGFDKTRANAVIAAGHADAVAFGRAFIANPDLPYRLQIGAELNAYDRATFYGGDDKGYTDYPALSR